VIKSMTAYGQGEYERNGTVFSAEVKSLNNRYRDIILHLPASLQGLEDSIRAWISSRVGRGRIEISIQVDKKNKETNYDFELNRPLIRSYLDMFRQLGNEFGLDKEVGPDDLLQIKDAFFIKSREIDVDESRVAVQEVLNQALDSLDIMRNQEGRAIEEDISKRLAIIKERLDYIEEKSPLVVEEYMEKLRSRIEMMSDGMELDEGRLEQEVAIFASRCDITEEVVRVKSHLAQFYNYMSMKEAVGRRLDFLVQELNREINTISSKASNASISAYAVEVKAELEKIREQIQNIE
jgi:uncharacterized protein (TIGR00255 family)